MRGLVDRPASEVAPGDTIVEPISGALSSVKSATRHGDMVALQVEYLGSGSKCGLTFKGERLLRCLPRKAGPL